MKVQKQAPEYSKQAKKFITNLDENTKSRIEQGIRRIPEGNIKAYSSKHGTFRVRVGDYRILYNWITDTQIYIQYIEHRGKVYR